MDTYEVAAIGDLYKKNVSGRKTWNLREFALTGVQLIYYKKGVKRGEWDISGCKVRKITPEEAGQAAAKFAFAIEGNKKQFLLSANNERNRDLWISVLEKQIHEFRNPVRRFIRTGEIVHANGFVKRKNMFGKTPILLVVTNYPRIIEIDPATIELIDQYSWVPSAPPTMTKIADSRFKIMIGGKELRFEDPANGMAYWEALFLRIHRIELWTPSKQPTLRIGFPGTSRTTPKAEEKKAVTPTAETSKDLKFLEEAYAHIQELLHALNSKIEEIDLVFVLAVQQGIDLPDDNSTTAQERQLKRSQLLMLKENIDVIADNLKSLIQRSKQTGSALFDVAAIESVISEAATLLVLLNSEDDDDAEDNAQEEFVEDVKNIDEMVAKVEEDTFETMRMSTLTRDFSNVREPGMEIEITSKNYDPKDPSKRPDGWQEVLMKRVLTREQADRGNGLDEDTIVGSRGERIRAEDAIMVGEVAKTGRVEGPKPVGRKRAATLQNDVSSFDINSDNFFAPNPNKRPNFWAEVRTKRVMLKEHIDRINGVPESTIVDQRPLKEIDEELELVSEVLCYGRLLNVGEEKIARSEKASLTFAQADVNPATPNKRPAGWKAVLDQRVMLKELEERLNGDDENSITARRNEKDVAEDEHMCEEAKHGSVTILGVRVIPKKHVAHHKDRANEVQADEVTEFIPSTVPSQEIEMPVQYKDEIINFGNMVISAPAPAPSAKAAAPVAAAATATSPKSTITGPVPTKKPVESTSIKKFTNVDPDSFKNSSDRPAGWAEIKLRRVYLKEWEDRKNGLDEDDILEKRYQRELEAEQEMVCELGVKGKIALFEKGFKKPVKKTTYKKTKEEFAAFMEASNSSLFAMNQNISKIVIN